MGQNEGLVYTETCPVFRRYNDFIVSNNGKPGSISKGTNDESQSFKGWLKHNAEHDQAKSKSVDKG